MSGRGIRRILHVVAGGAQGGETTFVLALVDALVKRRSEGVVTSVIGQADSYLLGCASALGATTFGVDFFRSRIDPQLSLRLRTLLRSIKPDLVHVHGGRAAFPLSFVLRDHPHCRIVYTVHGYHFSRQPLGRRALGAIAERWISSRVGKTVFVSDSDRRIAEKWHLVPSKATCCVIRNAIDFHAIPQAVSMQPRLIAFSGRLHFQKDPLFFVDIARELASEGYTFVMMGSGDMEPEVRAKIAAYGLDSVLQLHTGLCREDAFELLRKASVCVLTSRWEGLPLLPLEAMAMGVPVVAPNLECMTEVMHSGIDGILVSERSPTAFAAAVRKLANDDTLHGSIVRAARDRVLRDFSFAKWLAGYWELYGLDAQLLS